MPFWNSRDDTGPCGALAEVIDMCGKADEMWEERKKTREEEIAAISEVRAAAIVRPLLNDRRWAR